MTTETTQRDSATITADIEQIRGELLYLRPQAIAPIKQLVADLTTDALLDEKAIPSLRNAKERLDAALAEHERQSALQAQQRRLSSELDQAQLRERLAAVDAANAALSDAQNDFLAAGQELIKAYRRLLQQRRRNANVPGARASFPSNFDWHFAPALPAGWVGTTAAAMQAGFLPIEQKWAATEEANQNG